MQPNSPTSCRKAEPQGALPYAIRWQSLAASRYSNETTLLDCAAGSANQVVEKGLDLSYVRRLGMIPLVLIICVNEV